MFLIKDQLVCPGAIPVLSLKYYIYKKFNEMNSVILIVMIRFVGINYLLK